MKSSFRYLVAMVLIIIIAGIDYQLFSEGMGKIVRPEARQLGHLLLLLPIAITGSIAWKSIRSPFSVGSGINYISLYSPC